MVIVTCSNYSYWLAVSTAVYVQHSCSSIYLEWSFLADEKMFFRVFQSHQDGPNIHWLMRTAGKAITILGN